MTPNLPGDLLIIFALACNVVVGVSYFLVSRGQSAYEKLGLRAYHLFTLFTTLAVGYLYVLFYTHNFAVKYVVEYSNRAQPSLYILSAFWGGQEGTYLLWLFFNALAGYIIFKKGGPYRNHAMAVYSVVNLFFLLILFKLSPFALSAVVPADGEGLNPLLRDPWMIVHPPVIFMGYAIVAIPFSLAIAALLKNDYTSWLKRAFPWVAIAALTLGAGNILGGFWAYKTLGWGGFWSWDPVENSSFVPWLIALALLHGLIIERRTGALRRTNLFLAAFLFLLVVYGTFLTRSGVLADFSVHSFTDLGINNYLIAFMVATVILSVLPLAIRYRSVPTTPLNYNYFGREFVLYAGMALLAIFGVVVLVWTSLPLLTKLFGLEPRAADVSTYNHFAVPLVILFSLIVGVAPFSQYGEFRPSAFKRKLLIISGLGILIGIGLFVVILKADLLFGLVLAIVATALGAYLLRVDLRRMLIPSLAVFVLTIVIAAITGVRDYLFLLFLATAAMAATSNAISIVGFFPDRWKLAGGPLTHFGFGLLLIGILATTAFPDSQKIIVGKGESGEAYGLKITYDGMLFDMQHPNNEIKLSIDDHGAISEARPQLYYSERMQGTMRKPYILRSFLADLYMAPEEVQKTEQESDGLVLAKGETKQLGEFKITFNGFSMGQHGDSAASSMKVAAQLTVVSSSDSSGIEPATEHTIGADGQPVLKDLPAEILAAGGKGYAVHLSRILADQGQVVLTIPGLTQSGGGERLVLDVSRKPLINLVWGGAFLIILGSILVFIRRREELDRKDQPASPALAESTPQITQQ